MFKEKKTVKFQAYAVASIVFLCLLLMAIMSPLNTIVFAEENQGNAMPISDGVMQRSSIQGADYNAWNDSFVSVNASVSKNYLGTHTNSGVTRDVYDLIYTISITANAANKMKIYEWQNYSVNVFGLSSQFVNPGVLSRESSTTGKVTTSGFGIDAITQSFAIHSTLKKAENLATNYHSGSSTTYNWRGLAGEMHSNGENQTVQIGIRVSCASDFVVTLELPLVAVRKDIFSKVKNYEITGVLTNRWTMD